MALLVYPLPLRAGYRMGSQRGFTLIELVVVMAILGLMAAMAYPSFTRHLQLSMRTDAQAGLLRAAEELERCYTRTFAYHQCAITPESPDQRYAITPADITAHTYVLSASSKQEDGCESAMTLDSRGERLPEACW